MATLEFFFDCSSPWTYLAFTRIQPIVARTGADIVWKPILVGGVFNAVNRDVYERRANPDPRKAGDVLGVAEKLPISELCCTGLYHFRRAGDFRWAYRNPQPPRSPAERRERYVAPLYNALIARGERIGMQVIDPADVIFCGTPEEYEQAIGSKDVARRLRS